MSEALTPDEQRVLNSYRRTHKVDGADLLFIAIPISREYLTGTSDRRDLEDTIGELARDAAVDWLRNGGLS